MAVDFQQVMAQLEALGTAQNRKVYQRHGVQPPLFGVSYAEMGKLAKKLKNGAALVFPLWDSGNHDARVLAMAISQGNQAEWDRRVEIIEAVSNHVLAGSVVPFLLKFPDKLELLASLINCGEEWPSSLGWNMLAEVGLAEQLGERFFLTFLGKIEQELRQAPNRTRHAMNNALISIGARNESLKQRAFEVADKVGKVVVDHGETGCKTPDAKSYIQKTIQARALREARNKNKKNAAS